MIKHIIVLLFVVISVGLVTLQFTKLAQNSNVNISGVNILLSKFGLASTSLNANSIPPHTDTLTLGGIINHIRTSQGFSSLIQNSAVCNNLSNPSVNNTDTIFASCPNCRQVAIIKITSLVDPQELESYLRNDASAKDILLNPQLNHLCLKEKDNMHSIYIMAYEPKPEANLPEDNLITPKAIPIVKPATQEIKNFTEDELFHALVNYRQAHNRSSQSKDEKLCEYARKRVQDHLTDFSSKPPESYPVPEKYPLDAHAGFATDADSGYAFDFTGKNRLAENLAYWPSATYANQVIEWGWDSSTEGHREAQLSNEYGSACISGRDGFYVAIFGN